MQLSPGGLPRALSVRSHRQSSAPTRRVQQRARRRDAADGGAPARTGRGRRVLPRAVRCRGCSPRNGLRRLRPPTGARPSSVGGRGCPATGSAWPSARPSWPPRAPRASTTSAGWLPTPCRSTVSGSRSPQGPGRHSRVAATDVVSGRIEDLQVLLGQGPCVDAVSTGAPVLVDDITRQEVADRWPVFAPEARGDRGPRLLRPAAPRRRAAAGGDGPLPDPGRSA